MHSLHQLGSIRKRDSRRSPLFLAAAFILVIWGVHEARSFLMPICVAALVTFLMTPAMRLFKRLKLPEPICMLVSALLLLAPLVGAIYLMISQIQSLFQDWPQLRASLQIAMVAFRSTTIAHPSKRLGALRYWLVKSTLLRVTTSKVCFT